MTTEKGEEEVEEEEWGEKRGETEGGGGAGGGGEKREEREEEPDDTVSLSQTLSDSSVCSSPRKLSSNPRCENLAEEGGVPTFRRLVEEGKPHGKSPVQGLSLWQITTLRERNKQIKQKIMRNILRIVFKV